MTSPGDRGGNDACSGDRTYTGPGLGLTKEIFGQPEGEEGLYL